MSNHQQAVAVVMAAGKGTRMESDDPKVLVPVCERPMIDYVLDALEVAGFTRIIVVVGYKAERVEAHLATRKNVEFALQEKQLGTGHAVMVCEPLLANYDGPTMVLAGDSPMVRSESLKSLLENYRKAKPSCLIGTTTKENPTGMGRILRNSLGDFQGIVEEKDATDEQREIQEVNLSYYLFSNRDLFWSLKHIQPNNKQGELYLTDCPKVLLEASQLVLAWPGLHPSEANSVNNRIELAIVEQLMQHERSENL